MHVLDSQDEQDPPTITDTLRIILCTVLKFRLVMGDDHKGKILKYMTGYGGLTEDKTRGEAVSTGIWVQRVTLVVSQRRYLHAGVTLVLPQSFQDGVRVLACLAFHHAPTQPESKVIQLLILFQLYHYWLLVTQPYNYSLPWGRDPLTPWTGTPRNSMSSLPYLTLAALIQPREAFREGLFLSNSRPPASLLRKWRGCFAVSKDLCMLPNLSSTVSLHSLGRVPVCTAGTGPPTQHSTAPCR